MAAVLPDGNSRQYIFMLPAHWILFKGRLLSLFVNEPKLELG